MTRPDRPEAELASGRQRRGRDGDLAEALAGLASMDILTLRSEWRRLYRSKPPPRLGRSLLELVVAWKLQEQALGGLNAVAKRQLSDLAGLLTSKADLPKSRQPRLKLGARLIRQWGGTTHEVAVIEDGFVWNGRRWASLSVIAREITGARWSGPRFFGLKGTSAKHGGTSGEHGGADA